MLTRKLNAVTKVDAFPMPTVDAILGYRHGANIFSSIDLRRGFWQMGVAPEDVKKMTFICEGDPCIWSCEWSSKFPKVDKSGAWRSGWPHLLCPPQ